MKNWPVVMVFCFLFCSCKKKDDSQQEVASAQSVPPSISSAPSGEKIDTTYQTQYPYKRREYPYMKRQSEFIAGDDVYKAYTEGYSLNDSSFIVIQRDSAQGKLKSVQILKAHNHVYSIKLTKNGKTVFDKKYTKHDFLKLGDDGFIIESVPMAADFRGVSEDGRVLFDMWFGYPNSDFGGISFFATDLEGNLLQLESYSSTGGNGCDGQVHTSPNRQYFLNCHTLYGPDGYTFKFGRPDMVTAKFLSDTSFIALYDYVEHSFDQEKREWDSKHDMKTDNLVFYHVDGRQLASYRYDGFYNELDYTVPMIWMEDSGVFFLLDEEKKRLHSYSKAEPKKSEILSLKDITQLKKPSTKEDWKVYPIEGSFLGKKYSFYFSADTLKAFYVKKG